MDKKYVMAGLLAVIIIAAALMLKSAPQNTAGKTGCDWRLTKGVGCFARGEGYYYDGKNCVAENSCVNPPFKTIDECKAQCEK